MAEKYVSVSALRELLNIQPEGDCEKCEHHRWNGCYNDELVRACEAIDDAPEADVVEVVRCKDCKQLCHDEHGYWCINDYQASLDPEKDYCSRAVRRADNG